MVKEVGTDWVSLCWKRPDVKRTTAPFLMYKVEAWLCGEGAYWVEVGRSPIPQFDIFNLKPNREYYFRQASLRSSTDIFPICGRPVQGKPSTSGLGLG